MKNILTESKTIKKYVQIIDWAGFSIIGIFCLFYSIYDSNFAELHISLPFLDFPIFIGEILLAFCIVLFIARCKIAKFSFNKWHYLLLGYVCWILIKALEGYFSFGPLSFRNAALFYYPLFAVLGYNFYRSEYFTQKTIPPLLLILITVKMITVPWGYSTLPFFILLLILIMKIEKRYIKYLVLVPFSCLFPYEIFVQGSRTVIISSNISALFLIVTFFIAILRIKKVYRLSAFFIVVSVFIICFVRFTNKDQIKSMLTPLHIIEEFKLRDSVIEAQRRYFKQETLSAQLYNDNKETRPGYIPTGIRNRGFAKRTSDEEPSDKAEISVDDISKTMKDELGFVAKQTISEVDDYPKPLEKTKVFVEDINKAVRNELGIIAKQTISEVDDYSKQYVSQAPQEDFSKKVERIASSQVPKKNFLKKVEKNLMEDFSRHANGVFKKQTEEFVNYADYSMTFGIKKKSLDNELATQIEVYRKRLNETKEIMIQTLIKNAKGKIKRSDIKNTEEKINNIIEQTIKSLLGQKDFIVGLLHDKNLRIVRERKLTTEYNNILFRLFIWRDMVEDLIREKPWFGFSFGKPQRSISLEVTTIAWGDWHRDGWITPHNAFLHIIYRAGVLGVFMIVFYFGSLFVLVKEFIKQRSAIGLLLVSILIYWTVVASFLVVLELPYQAIPFWSIWGMTFAYIVNLRDKAVT